MSELFTTIAIDEHGMSERGRRSRAEMIDAFRKHALRQKREAEFILGVRDADFIVEQHRGVYRRTAIKRLEPDLFDGMHDATPKD